MENLSERTQITYQIEGIPTMDSSINRRRSQAALIRSTYKPTYLISTIDGVPVFPETNALDTSECEII